MTYPCTGKQAIFFPDDRSKYKAQEAKALCQTCTNKEPCLEMALLNNEPYGVWGGMTPKERRSIRVGYPKSRLFYPPKREPMSNIDRDPAFMNSGYYGPETASG